MDKNMNKEYKNVTMAYCNKCENQIVEGSAFCNKCGSSIVSNTEVNTWNDCSTDDSTFYNSISNDTDDSS